MKTIPILYILVILFSACSGSDSSSTLAEKQQKEEMTDTLVPADPEMAPGKVDIENASSEDSPAIEQPAKAPAEKQIKKNKETKKTGDKIVENNTPDKKEIEPAKEEIKKEEPPKTEPVVIKEPEVAKEEVKGPEAYKLSNGQMKIEGTSTLHDWDMTAINFSTEALVLLNASNELISIESLTLTMPVKNLKGKESKLNENGWEALKADQHKNITFKLNSVNIAPQKSNVYLVKATGNITIAGVTREINMDATCRVNDNKTLTFTGTKIINMTDYKVKPPTFMMGAMKTGENVTLNFNVVMSR